MVLLWQCSFASAAKWLPSFAPAKRSWNILTTIHFTAAECLGFQAGVRFTSLPRSIQSQKPVT